MKNIILTCFFAFMLIGQHVFADTSFSLPGDGKWYRLATMGGRHAYFEYIYSHGTGNNPSISTGEVDFINAQNFMVQHHQTMGYQAWNQPQFALINFGDWSDVIVPLNNVSIGTGTIDPNYKLAVKGNIHALGVKVETENWPDYVFKPSYLLPSLSDVKSYIAQNHHLPDMPSEQEVKDNGLDQGEMVRLQTKKIEELTLYLIEKDKEVKAQCQINRQLQSEIKGLRKDIQNIKKDVYK